ncbi:MAG TPA: hypothetical protein VFT45_01105, partial [Longimicrobium sp.]|nr:hypothetical protein [Longimicrobium sp.]
MPIHPFRRSSRRLAPLPAVPPRLSTLPRSVRIPLLLCVLPLLCAAPLRAQTDLDEPWVTFEPGSGTFTAASLTVTVRFSDNASLNTTGTRTIVFNDQTVTSQFTHSAVTTQTQPIAQVTTTSSATLTLQPGTNTLSASICDNAGNCSSPSSATYTFVAGRPAVRVSPDGGSATIAPWSDIPPVFRVVNPGTGAGTYRLRPECRDAWTGA